MSDAPQQLPRTLWIGLILVLVMLCMAYALSRRQTQLCSPAALPVLGPVADFALMDQGGRAVTLADLSNHVWVADIIFTRCAGSCPIMSREMSLLQAALPPPSRARLVTLTTDPDFDTPPILKIRRSFRRRFQSLGFPHRHEIGNRPARRQQPETHRRADKARGTKESG